MTQHASERPTGSIDDQLTTRLLSQRIIVLGQEVDDTIANRLCAELILSAEQAVAYGVADAVLDSRKVIHPGIRSGV